MRVANVWESVVNAVEAVWDRIVASMTRGQRLRFTLALGLALWLVLIVSAVARADGIEIDEHFCEIAARRIEAATLKYAQQPLLLGEFKVRG